MPVKVVDASGACGPIVRGARGRGDRRADLGDARLVAPSLLGFELTNVCLIKSRRHPEQRSSLTAAFGLRARLAVEEVAVDHDGALELAITTGLTAYDASYLWLTRQLAAELVTLDRQLARAAEGYRSSTGAR